MQKTAGAKIHTKYLGEAMEDDTFKAFVYDFYYALEDSEEGSTYQDICREIFGTPKQYRKFLHYCKQQNFSFLPVEQRYEWKIGIYLLAFEQVALRIKDHVFENINTIMGIQDDILELSSSNDMIPGSTTTFWTGLRMALYFNILVNNHGQMLYFLENVDDLYQVYSRELGIHIVDTQGQVTTLEQHNRGKRRIALKEKEKYQRFLDIFGQENGEQDEDDTKILQDVIQLFASCNSVEWETLQGKEKSLHALKIRFFVISRLRDFEIEFDTLRHDQHTRPAFQVIHGGKSETVFL